MYARLEGISRRLEWLGLKHYANSRLMLERLAGSSDVDALQVLASVVEPAKGYARDEAKTYDSATPLNRLVDTVAPESEVARNFAGMVEHFLKDSSKDRNNKDVRRWLETWRTNDAELGPTLQDNLLLREIAPLSRDLAAVSATGLQALDYIASTNPVPVAWRDQQ